MMEPCSRCGINPAERGVLCEECKSAEKSARPRKKVKQ